MRPIDLDGLFEKFVKNHIKENKIVVGDNFDDLLSEIYEKFDGTAFSELDGKTPVSYFEDDAADYGALILQYQSEGMEIPDYFIDGAVKCAKEDDLIRLLEPTFDEDVVIPAIDILDKKNSKKPFNRYIDLLFDKNTDPCIVDKIAEVLSFYADDVADEILIRLDGAKRIDSVFSEILSHCNIRRDGIKSVLLRGLFAGDRIEEYCSYLVKYGDESVLDDLYSFIGTVEEYVPYKELSIAIEALGGSPVRERDFENDLDYIAIKNAEKVKKDEPENKDR